jgi:hypothetical protein
MHADLTNRGGKLDRGRINEFSTRDASLLMLFARIFKMIAKTWRRWMLERPARGRGPNSAGNGLMSINVQSSTAG